MTAQLLPQSPNFVPVLLVLAGIPFGIAIWYVSYNLGKK